VEFRDGRWSEDRTFGQNETGSFQEHRSQGRTGASGIGSCEESLFFVRMVVMHSHGVFWTMEWLQLSSSGQIREGSLRGIFVKQCCYRSMISQVTAALYLDLHGLL